MATKTKTKHERLAPKFKQVPPVWSSSEINSDCESTDDEESEDNTYVPTKLPEELLKTLIKPAGQLLMFGLVNWDKVGKWGRKQQKGIVCKLYTPHRFTDLKVRLAVSGCVSAHSVLITEEGKAMTFGRNQYGQLGIGNTTTMATPTLVTTLQKMNVIGAATGNNHTLFLTDTGTVYACGANKSGQCGIEKCEESVLTPVRIDYNGPPIVKVGCGADFSTILDVKGRLHAFGIRDHKHLVEVDKDIVYFPLTPTPHFETEVTMIRKYTEANNKVTDVQIVDFSCGQCHTIAVSSKKKVYSWGIGGHGRLGRPEPSNTTLPRLIKYFNSQARAVRSVHCGSTYSLAVTELDAVYLFGQIKRTGGGCMYPTPIQEFAGKIIHHVGTGFNSVLVAADDSVFAWGTFPTYGQLGLGRQQISSTPKEVTCLNGIKVLGLSMGMSHTLLIAQNDTPEQQEELETFELYEP